MKPLIIVGAVIATLALAGSSLAFGDAAQHRIATPPATGKAQPLPASLMKAERAVGKMARIRVRCQTLGCVNGALTELAKAFRTLNGCLSYMNVARYPGYLYSNDGGATHFLTGALDQAEPGEPANKAVILVC